MLPKGWLPEQTITTIYLRFCFSCTGFQLNTVLILRFYLSYFYVYMILPPHIFKNSWSNIIPVETLDPSPGPYLFPLE